VCDRARELEETMNKTEHHRATPAGRGMKRHHKLLVAVAVVLALGWLAWNALLVESDVGGAVVEAGATAR